LVRTEVEGVELEVDEPLGEYEHVTLVEDLGKQGVVWVGGDKPNIECPLEHREDFSSTWVCVRGVLT